MGVLITIFYVLKIEAKSFSDIGGHIDDSKKIVLYSILGFIPLIAMLPLINILVDIEINLKIGFEKIVGTTSFAILAAIYEEIMFRGIIQNHVLTLTSNDTFKSIIITALIFTITHIFYLPFDGYGIYYIFVCVMALILGWLRSRVGLVPPAIVHGGIVFLLLILT